MAPLPPPVLASAGPVEPAVAGLISWTEAIDRYRDHQRDRLRRRDTYVKSCHARLRLFAEAQCIARVCDATPPLADAWLASKLASGSSPKYVNDVIGTLRGFGQWAWQQGLLDRNPFAVLERVAEDRGEAEGQGPRALTLEEVLRLIAVARESDRVRPRRSRLAWLQYLLMAGTGFRTSEVAPRAKNGNPNGGLVWGDVNTKAGTIRLRPEAAKKRNVAKLPMHPAIAEALERERMLRPREPDSAYIVGRAVEDTLWRSDLDRACVPYIDNAGRRATPISLRKFYITRLDELVCAGVIPEIIRNELTRHSAGRNTAEKHYIDHGHKWAKMVEAIGLLGLSGNVGRVVDTKTGLSTADFAAGSGPTAQTCRYDVPNVAAIAKTNGQPRPPGLVPGAATTATARGEAGRLANEPRKCPEEDSKDRQPPVMTATISITPASAEGYGEIRVTLPREGLAALLGIVGVLKSIAVAVAEGAKEREEEG